MAKQSFSICSFNCNGLGENQKRQDIFDFLRTQKQDIYLLQETHWKAETENIVRSCWGYNCFIAGNNTNKNGVAILFSNTFEYKLHDVIRDPNGCYIFLDIEFLGKRITLANIYGPSQGDKPEFFSSVFDLIDKMGNPLIIVGGDWNVIQNPIVDARNLRSFTNRRRSRNIIIENMQTLGLVDVWREIFPSKRGYTWRRFNSVQQSRLDYFLISETLLCDVNDSKIVAGYRSDHSIISLGLKNDSTRQRDKPFWKFNNSLLKDTDYVNLIKELILKVKCQYCVPVYNQENINNISNEELLFVINDQLFFETLLMEIRGKSISYASYKKRSEKQEEENLILEINTLEQSTNIDQESMMRLEDRRARLEELRNKKVEGMVIRSRLRWIQEGEKPSRYFCNLESRNFISKCMPFIEKSDGEIIYSEKDILNEAKEFYQNLYGQREVMDVNIDNLVHDVPKLDDDEKLLLEGLITYAEAHAALRSMQNNKSPGCDGFTCEFFKFFFQDIGVFLVRSVNFGFLHGSLSVTQKQGVITCIPKDGKPKQFLKNWRPISLLNTTYKIASSCIAARIKSFLPKIIHTDQTGFMKGRYIGENIRLMYDLLLYTAKENIPGLIVLIDFEKAFDSISWSFIIKALEFFNFGNDIRQWIQTFYSDIKSCVISNGLYSPWFCVARGVRQGDPLSPYLYLICAEVLSIMLRQNLNIKGIKMREKDIMLSQFADDTALYLDGSEQSFVEAVRLLKQFAIMSGLNINFEKTQAVWIGSSKGSGVRFLRDMNFCWDPGIFRYLGILFSTRYREIVHLNYEGKLREITALLNTWSKRHLTPFGKITVLKTLAISKLTYLFVNLPDPDDLFLKELNNVFFKFLWNSKTSRIGRRHVCQSYLQGGLQMIDIFSFLSAMKISWLRRVIQVDSTVRKNVLMFFPNFEKLQFLGSEYANVLINDIYNPFWHDVLKHYKKLCVKCKPIGINEFNAECIFYNVNITRGGHVVYVKSWLENNVYQVCHLLDENGSFFTFEDFRARFPNIVTNFLHYRGIIDAIKKYRDLLNVVSEPNYMIQGVKVWKTICIDNKSVQSILTSPELPAAMCKWNNYFEDLYWKEIFKKCFNTSNDCQIKWFQYRLLYRILPTCRYLFLCKIVDSPQCSFCDSEEETLYHLFWECQYVNIFWNELLRLMSTKCPILNNFSFTEQLVLLGTQKNVKTDSVMDFVILLAKYFIYKCKWTKSIPTTQPFLVFLRFRYTLEKYQSIRNNRLHQFDLKWFMYKSIME